MKEQSYLEERVENQRIWYSSKAQTNRQWFITFRIFEIVAAALIPFLTGLAPNSSYSELLWIVIGGLGVLIAISGAVSSLNKYQENWITYRTTAEQLKHEKYAYLTQTGPYADAETRFETLVERVEGLISKEHSNWATTARKQEPLPVKGPTAITGSTTDSSMPKKT